MATNFSKILFSLILFPFCIVTSDINFSSTHQVWGAVVNHDKLQFSLDVKGEPLSLVLKKISKLTGYNITVNKKWADLPVTATLTDTNLHKCLKNILRKTNNTVVINENEKSISIDVYDTVISSNGSTDTTEKTIDPLNVEVIPPEVPGERGITQSELNSILASQGRLDPLDVEVIPPEVPGERGITQSELNSMLASQDKADPLDVEVIPPEVPGERGITQSELNSILASQSRVDPLDVEVIPPEVPGERGITQRELNAILFKEKAVESEDP